MSEINKAFIDIRLRLCIATSLAMHCHTAKRDVIRKTGSTYHIAMPQEEDRATATWDLHNKFPEDMVHLFHRCARRQTDRQTERPTYRQTDKLIAIHRSPTMAE